MRKRQNTYVNQLFTVWSTLNVLYMEKVSGAGDAFWGFRALVGWQGQQVQGECLAVQFGEE